MVRKRSVLKRRRERRVVVMTIVAGDGPVSDGSEEESGRGESSGEELWGEEVVGGASGSCGLRAWRRARRSRGMGGMVV